MFNSLVAPATVPNPLVAPATVPNPLVAPATVPNSLARSSPAWPPGGVVHAFASIRSPSVRERHRRPLVPGWIHGVHLSPLRPRLAVTVNHWLHTMRDCRDLE